VIGMQHRSDMRIVPITINDGLVLSADVLRPISEGK